MSVSKVYSYYVLFDVVVTFSVLCPLFFWDLYKVTIGVLDVIRLLKGPHFFSSFFNFFVHQQ